MMFFPALAVAQQSDGNQTPSVQATPPMPCMAGMRMPGCSEPSGDESAQPKPGADLMTMSPQNFLQAIVSHTGSGTSAEPISTPTPMLMTMKGKWSAHVPRQCFHN